MDLASKLGGVIVHHNTDIEMRSERALPLLYPACTPLPTQSKTGSCQCEKPICVQKQNISSANNGLNHSVIASHAKQDLIKGAARPRSPLSTGKIRWTRTTEEVTDGGIKGRKSKNGAPFVERKNPFCEMIWFQICRD